MEFAVGIREFHLLKVSVDVSRVTLLQGHDRFDLLQDLPRALEHLASIVRSIGDERQPVAPCLVLEGFCAIHACSHPSELTLLAG
jgi:hypothetical protein